jgi:hypothetical protein
VPPFDGGCHCADSGEVRMSALTEHCKGRFEKLVAIGEERMKDEYGAMKCAGMEGHLRACVRLLCKELDGFHGTNPGKGTYARMPLGDAVVLVDYDYEPGEDPVMDLNSPMCGPGCSANASILAVLINGTWCDPEDFADASTLDAWREAICERKDSEREDAMAERDEREVEYDR